MKPLKIDVLATDGSPIGVTEESIYGRDGRTGVGGAELAILTLMRGWHDRGHEVTFYNNPTNPRGSAFNQRITSLFNPRDERDILIVFRSPNKRAQTAKGKKIWFSTDQYTIGSFKDFAPHMDEIVTISPFHAAYFESVYQITNTHTIDLPVRLWDYDIQVPKVEDSLIFCSVPDRGLHILASVYDELVRKIPNISLTITSDYRLWGVGSPMNEKYIRKFLGKPKVRFLGAVSREELVKEQLAAQIHAYPCIYEELFCYSVAECQVAGCYPITSQVGALHTTNMGLQIPGNPESSEWQKRFVDEIELALKSKNSLTLCQDLKEKSMNRFYLGNILDEWDKVFYG